MLKLRSYLKLKDILSPALPATVSFFKDAGGLHEFSEYEIKPPHHASITSHFTFCIISSYECYYHWYHWHCKSENKTQNIFTIQSFLRIKYLVRSPQAAVLVHSSVSFSPFKDDPYILVLISN